MKFNSYTVGQEFFTPQVTITKEEIIEFGMKYDPQYFHINEDEAKEGPFGSLIASGFQSLAVVWSEWIKMDILGRDCLGGLGADKMRWKKPVQPGDELSGRFTVLGKKKASDGKRGLLTLGIVIKNQKEQEVLSCSTNVYIVV